MQVQTPSCHAQVQRQISFETVLELDLEAQKVQVELAALASSKIRRMGMARSKPIIAEAVGARLADAVFQSLCPSCRATISKALEWDTS